MRPMDLGPAGRAIDPTIMSSPLLATRMQVASTRILTPSCWKISLIAAETSGSSRWISRGPGAGDARPLAFDRRADYHQDRVVGRGCVISRSAAGLAVPETLREQVRITSSAFGTRSSSWNKKRASVFRLRRCLDETDNHAHQPPALAGSQSNAQRR